MAIPNNIAKEHLLKAIEKIEKEGIPSGADSQYYDVVFNGKKYPPKVIVSYANIFANGVELNRDTFSGGLKTPCFQLLQKNGFEITEKNTMGYYNELIKFLAQAKTDDLGTTRNNYVQKYLALDIKISFGQGGAAKIPWISFLASNQTTSNGIYPVYLYFKSQNLLVLAYGVSVTNVPSQKWLLDNPKTISEYFFENGLGVPFNYGNSFIFKVYDTNHLPVESIMDKDLNEILNYYNSINFSNNFETEPQSKDFKIEFFQKGTQESGLIFSPQLIQRFIASLCTKPFVICSGLSGSGKTKLAQAFAQWLSADKTQYLIVPVGADWTNREPLLGYSNALAKNEYVSPENGVLDLIIRAKENIENNEVPTMPYFLILDEMNLSHVERYFADFLSTMESGDVIPLHKIDNESKEIPQAIKLPKNLFIIGTVNIDETTYMFSPKVLDRANTIEFRLTEKDLEDFIASDIKLDMELLKAKGANMSESFMKMALLETEKNLKPTEADLILFFTELKKSGAEFGYRTASEIGRLMYMLKELGEGGDNLLDIAIMQKLLPKLHGSRNKLSKVLPILGGFCLTNDSKIKEDYLDRFVSNSLTEAEIKSDTNIKYKISFEKICRMYKNAVENGFASYAEA
jgi:5-methylcytosine-specific restriction protein B